MTEELREILSTPEAKRAQEIATQFILKKVGLYKEDDSTIRDEVRILLRLYDEVENGNGTTLDDLCESFDLYCAEARDRYEIITKEIFSDGVNWGRIVMIFLFSAKLALQCKENEHEHLIREVIDWVRVAIGKRSYWIKNAGNGWVSIISCLKFYLLIFYPC